MSKSGEVLTVSTDGRVLIWDVKKMDKPMENETVILQPKTNEGGPKGILGGVSLDYDPLVCSTALTLNTSIVLYGFVRLNDKMCW